MLGLQRQGYLRVTIPVGKLPYHSTIVVRTNGSTSTEYLAACTLVAGTSTEDGVVHVLTTVQHRHRPPRGAHAPLSTAAAVSNRASCSPHSVLRKTISSDGLSISYGTIILDQTSPNHPHIQSPVLARESGRCRGRVIDWPFGWVQQKGGGSLRRGRESNLVLRRLEAYL